MFFVVNLQLRISKRALVKLKTTIIFMEQNTERKPFDLRGESKAYAIESIKLYQHLTEYAVKKEYTLSKHYLVASTRIGDFIRQENFLEACHAASSAKYWLELLYNGGYIDGEQASAMLNYCDPLVRILYVISHPESRKDKVSAPAEAPVSGSSAAGPQAAAPEASPSAISNPFAKKGGAL